MAPQVSNWQTTLAELPVSRFLSAESLAALDQFLRSGSSSQRVYRVTEFFKAIDWLPVEEIEPNPLKQLAATDRKRLYAEIREYFSHKETKRQARKEQREDYKLKVFEYYRANISQADKDLLERLRDYELEKIGQDINWRHYFWFTSFRQIDAFNAKTPEERKILIARFIQDVDQHFKNAERLREGTYAQYYWGGGFESAGETFDEWANRQTWQADPKQQKQRRQYRASFQQEAVSPLHKAYKRLELPMWATLSEVRQQFRRLTLQYHPDVPGGSEAEMKEILAAYNLVKKAVSNKPAPY
jgi:hypothetical protein